MPKKGRKTCKHLQYCQFSRSTLSSDSDSFSYPLGLTPVKSQKNLTSQAKRDYLARLYEKKKLKDKSLSKKLQTPFDRKLNRSCWPIQLSKISKIKKKPKEKKKGKPNYKSLRKKKSSKLMFFRNLRKARPRVSLSESSSELNALEEEMKNINPNHFLYKPVTPQMLMDVLQDPEHLKSGATLDMIIAKLKRDQPNLRVLNKAASSKNHVKSTVRS